jgi:hypothetical protein
VKEARADVQDLSGAGLPRGPERTAENLAGERRPGRRTADASLDAAGGEALGGGRKQVRVLGRGRQPDDRFAEERDRLVDSGEVRVEGEREMERPVVVLDRSVSEMDQEVRVLTAFAREVAGAVAGITVECDPKAPGLEGECDGRPAPPKPVGKLECDRSGAASFEFGRDGVGIDRERVSNRARSPSHGR